MRKSFRTAWETRKKRWKRHSGTVMREVAAGLATAAVAGVIAALMIFSYGFLLNAPVLRMEKTVVEGCRKVSEDEVRRLAGISPEQSLLVVNTGSVEKKVLANPWIEKARVSTEWPDRLVIKVTERKAVALIRRESTLFFLDREGNVFKKLDPDEKAEMPILTGFFDRGLEDKDLILKAIRLLDFLALQEGFPRLEKVSEIQGDPSFGFTLLLDNGLCIQIGFEPYERKLSMLRPVLVDLSRKYPEAFLNIDAKNPEKMTVQKRRAPVFPKFAKGYRT
ncbi:MAG TPA: FtsQ-type POTRA domain-containing protein [Syntrophales bacterium]|mgnify:CR=1 FL=1|nr:FtsQ-type POTRA domain-containing protein [Syntrophales bacterium]